MNSSSQDSTPNSIDIPQLARAIRFALVPFILGLSYFSFRASLSIDKFSRMFADLLHGQPLPLLAEFIIHEHFLFVAVAVLVPIIAIVMLFMRRLALSFYIIGILGFITVFQFIILYIGLSAPLAQIITSVSTQN